MDATRRFSDRAAEYARFRPGYPDALFADVLARLREHATPGTAVAPAADIGSGTGLFSRGLLAQGLEVFGVEPNAEMRAAAEQALSAELSAGRFHSVPGRAESTTLPAGSMSLVAAAQAFHWFDSARCRAEWRRISAPGALVALVWNQRERGGTFHNAYEALMASLGATACRDEGRDEQRVAEFFGGGALETRLYRNHQELDWEGLRGRVLSSSYVPLPGAPGHDALFRQLRQLYESHERGGRVRLEYTTRLHLGQLA